MKIIIDENIALAEETFGKFGEVISMHGRAISNSDLRDADALIVRSITNVNENLLQNTNVQFVGSATIGIDHVDVDYLKHNNIYFTDAKGCNAFAVAEFVLTAVAKFVFDNDLRFGELTAGIIGYGNIGTKVEKFFNALGIKTVVNDLPLQEAGNKNNFATLSEALSCDIVTLHVPLTTETKFPTNYLINQKNISKLKRNSLLINTSRGEVVDSEALLNAIETSNINAVIDVWEYEPEINKSLLQKVFIATPHIAGYSLEGKIYGTKIIYEKFCMHFKVQNDWRIQLPHTENNFISVDESDELEKILYKITKRIYEITADNVALKKTLSLTKKERGVEFDMQRKFYRLRREFNNYTIKFCDSNPELKNILADLRFSV